MRVISRRARPPVSSRGASSPYSSTSVAARAVEINCGRWLIQAQSWSCASASMLATPRANFFHPLQKFPAQRLQIFSAREPASQTTPHPGTRSASAPSTPDCSFPAMGCPARKRRPTFLPKVAVARARTSALVLPTSVSRVFCGKRRPQAPDQFDDGADRRRQQHHLAASHCVRGIGVRLIDRADCPVPAPAPERGRSRRSGQ